MKKIIVTQIKRIPFLKKMILKIFSIFPWVPMLLFNQGERYKKMHSVRQNKEILLDITCVYQNDLKTGVQRAVRSLMNEFQCLKFKKDYSVQPIFLTDKNDYWHYEYVPSDSQCSDEIVIPKNGDIFLGLDLNSSISGATESGLFKDWRERGTKIHFIVYDILPIEHPEWWPDGVKQGHEKWLKSVFKSSDSLFCISRSVSKSVEHWRSAHKRYNQKINWIHLGADIYASSPSTGRPSSFNKLLSRSDLKSFLAVGTIEPRKGYAQVIAAFEQLWQTGQDINLVIVGKQGWLVETLVEKLRNHPELNKRLFWLEGISDEYLEKIYAITTCLIAASEGEGFGLPLIEAAQHKLPIIARDIPVFREVAGEHAYYFAGKEPEAIATAVSTWLDLYQNQQHPKSDAMPWLTWKQSAEKLKKIITKDTSC